VYTRVGYIYASSCPPAHNCGRHAATRVLNAPCKVAVFQPAVTPDDVIVSRLPRLFRFSGTTARRALQIRLTPFVHARYVAGDSNGVSNVLLRVIIRNCSKSAIARPLCARVSLSQPLVAGARLVQISGSSKVPRTEPQKFAARAADRAGISRRRVYSFIFVCFL